MLAVLFALAAAGDEMARVELARPAMGTTFQVVAYAASGDSARCGAAIDNAFARAEELNSILSDYIDDSELNRVGTRPTIVSLDLFRVLDVAARVSRASNGAFDVTQGPVIRLWRAARRSGRLPDAEELRQARALTGYRMLKLNPARRTARLAKPGMRLDLGGIAKGFAADEMLRGLRDSGFPRAMVAAGGDVTVGDPPPGRVGWRVGLGSAETTEELSNCAISTSGDESQFVTIGGARYSHIVDPRTGIGLRDAPSVTVIAATGLEADPLATAASVIGVERLRKRFPRARFLVNSGIKGGRTSKPPL